jgi:AcrR family transcriptional regulator
MGAALGLREEKKARTRTNLTRCGIRLFARNGFRQTTVVDIAAAADVAPSTFFLHFATKYDLLFNAHREVVRGLEGALASREPGESTIDVVHRYYLERLEREASDELLVLRRKIMDNDPELLGHEQMRFSEALRPLLIKAFAQDLGTRRRSDERPRLLASLTIGALNEFGRITSPDGARTPRQHKRQKQFLDSVARSLHASVDEVAAREPANGAVAMA